MTDTSAPAQTTQRTLAMTHVSSLLDSVERPMLVCERSGRVVLANLRAQKCIKTHHLPQLSKLNLFHDVLKLEAASVLVQLESGEQEIALQMNSTDGNESHARIRWLPEADWLVVSIEATPEVQSSDDAAMRNTLQELLQEREITYRNLLAAYLRLQEVNRQKTVFLASAAHELKTPLAVMKGYYDLLLSGSLGKLSERQRDILQESKESCDRLVRLVSMFLNYSALESGKLVLHVRDNDLRDCLGELISRWQDAFVRKQVRLEARISGDLQPFKFDYQKVQQSVANLLDNALKHTPAGGSVVLLAEPHFWERRAAALNTTEDRRHTSRDHCNSVLVAVTDTGAGIAPEYHQEIFEEFVRVDRSSSGMGLGLAIVKRLIQAHRGKIWVDSELGRGCTFTFLLPTETE
ncbi:MAG: HAMP domain-containing histidine kinase [Acidobacteria bacterium]|nr:HAMP domain-containing histidine kinase [Acidobacteriota bacterium]MCL5289266.1 HAMP domain-containing histidine kinase [Acidobacteriota bacterium]